MGNTRKERNINLGITREERSIMLKQLQRMFTYFIKKQVRDDVRMYMAEASDLAAHIAVDVLADYCRLNHSHCQNCVFDNDTDMCASVFKIRQKTDEKLIAIANINKMLEEFK